MEIMRQSEQYPDSTDFFRVATAPGHDALGDDQYFYNRDPAQGHTVPQMHGGDQPGAVPVMPPAEAGPHGVRRMEPEETGLEYPVLAHPNEHGGFDVDKPLG